MWYFAEPLHTGIDLSSCTVEARQQVMHYSPSLLHQKGDKVALGFDEARNVDLLRTQVGHDLILLVTGRHERWHLLEGFPVQPVTIGYNAARKLIHFAHVSGGAEEIAEIRAIGS